MSKYNATFTFTSCLNVNVCWQCVYTQPYNDKDPPSALFIISLNHFRQLNIVLLNIARESDS